MTVVRTIIIIGLLLMIPSCLYYVYEAALQFVAWWRKLDWYFRFDVMLQAGFLMLIIGGALWCCIAAWSEQITADASTDTQQEIPPQVENCNQEELPQ